MTTKLGLYNGALRLIKERKLASLSENREPRRLLDDAYGDGQTEGSVKLCLELGQWTFATRTVQSDYSPSIEPPFGYQYAFDQPSDMVDVCGIFSDEYCAQPLLHYTDERHFWYCDLQTIYVQYVSNHTSYGADLSLWPESFVKVVEADLAREIAGNLTQGEDKVKLAYQAFNMALRDARSGDAMRKPAKFMPQGGWVTARRLGASRDRSGSRLIG